MQTHANLNVLRLLGAAEMIRFQSEIQLVTYIQSMTSTQYIYVGQSFCN